jgi:hypothetical protein
MNATCKHNPRHEQREEHEDSFASDAGTPSRSDAEDDELQHFHAIYRDAAYYSTGRDWSDYAPAYRYGREAFEHHHEARFEQIEAELARDWDRAKAPSRLAWVEARGAVLDAWQRAELRHPHGRRDPRAALSKH